MPADRRRASALLLAILAFVFVANAVAKPAAADSLMIRMKFTPEEIPAGGLVRLTGTVTNSAGQGVGGVVLELTSNPARYAPPNLWTESDGSFSTTVSTFALIANTLTVQARVAGTSTQASATVKLSSQPIMILDLIPQVPSVRMGGQVPVAGVVTDAYGAPARQVDVLVKAPGSNYKVVRTDDQGRFTATFPAPSMEGRYAISASVHGVTYPKAHETISVEVVPDRNPVHISLNFARDPLPNNTWVDFWGQVTDRDGNPIAGVYVNIMREAIAMTVASPGNRTDATGKFSGQAKAERYGPQLVTACALGYATEAPDGAQPCITVTVSVVVAASDQGERLSAQVPAAVAPGTSVPIAGRLTTASGQPVAERQVLAQWPHDDEIIRREVTTDAEGRFELNYTAPDGPDAVVITLDAAANRYRLPITVGVRATAVTLEAEPTAIAGSTIKLRGRVTGAGGVPVPWQKIDIWDIRTGRAISAVADAAGYWSAESPTGSDMVGSAAFSAVARGTTAHATGAVRLKPGTLPPTPPAPPKNPDETVQVVNTPAGPERLAVGSLVVRLPRNSLPGRATVRLRVLRADEAPPLPPSATPRSQVFSLSASDGQLAIPVTFSILGVGQLIGGLYEQVDAEWRYVGPGATAGQAPGTVSLPRFGTFVLLTTTETYWDVDRNHWFYTAVKELTAGGIISGMAQSIFSPYSAVTRAQFIKLLLTTIGLKPGAPTGLPFEDVPSHEWYAGYMAAAYSAGLLTGTAGRARPGDPITRQEAAQLLIRAAAAAQARLAVGETPQYKDQASIDPGLRVAVSAAGQAGLLKGYADGTFRPQQTLTRAEAAVVVHRLLRALTP